MTNDFISKDLLADVVHDLKSPLSAVRGYIDLVQQSGPLTDDQERYCDRAFMGLDRMEALIVSILDIVRLEDDVALDFKDCHLDSIITSTVDLVSNLAGKREIVIDIQIEDDLALIRGDKQLLGRAFNNLLTNAIKYNCDGGEIFVTVANQPDFLRVDVRDTGVGIPEQDQEQVFDRFFRASNSAQTRASGSGLGLAIVKAIIQKHGGYIWLQSVEGEGTTFSFTLPRKDKLNGNPDHQQEYVPDIGEGLDSRYLSYDELSIEEADDVDDNTQEARGSSEIDSSNDVV